MGGVRRVDQSVCQTIVFRNAATIAGAGIDYTFFGKTFSKASVASLGMTTIGMMFYAGNDLNYSSVGYFWLLVNAVATLANIFWNRVYISAYTKTKEQTTQGITFIQQVETLPIMMVLVSKPVHYDGTCDCTDAAAVCFASSLTVSLFTNCVTLSPTFCCFILLLTALAVLLSD